MTNIPTFSAGERLTAAKLNKLAAALRELQREAAASRITAVNGGTFSRTAGGTTLDVRRGAPPQVPTQQTASPQRHPFKVEVLEVAGERLIGVFEPRVYAVTAGASGVERWPVGPVFGEPGERFNTLEPPPAGRNSLYLNISLIPGYWSIEGGGTDGGLAEGFGLSGFSLDWSRGDGISIPVADVTRSVDEAGVESFSVVQHLRSSPFIPAFLPDPSRLMTAS